MPLVVWKAIAMTVVVTMASKEMAGTVPVSSLFLIKVHYLVRDRLLMPRLDLDECMSGNHNCPEQKVCTNTAGTYECTTR